MDWEKIGRHIVGEDIKVISVDMVSSNKFSQEPCMGKHQHFYRLPLRFLRRCWYQFKQQDLIKSVK